MLHSGSLKEKDSHEAKCTGERKIATQRTATASATDLLNEEKQKKKEATFFSRTPSSSLNRQRNSRRHTPTQINLEITRRWFGTTRLTIQRCNTATRSNFPPHPYTSAWTFRTLNRSAGSSAMAERTRDTIGGWSFANWRTMPRNFEVAYIHGRTRANRCGLRPSRFLMGFSSGSFIPASPRYRTPSQA